MGCAIPRLGVCLVVFLAMGLLRTNPKFDSHYYWCSSWCGSGGTNIGWDVVEIQSKISKTKSSSLLERLKGALEEVEKKLADVQEEERVGR